MPVQTTTATKSPAPTKAREAPGPWPDETDPGPSGRRRALVVLGMHRSGTSALTRMLGLAGARLPSHLLAAEGGLPMDGNSEAGFWESRSLMLLHEEALESAGSAWDDLCDVPSSWFDSEDAENFTRRLAETLEAEFEASPVFVAKDPRISRLAPLWKRALREMEVEASWMISLRNPLDVAASLTRRDGFAQAKGLLLWLSYMLSAERHTRHEPRFFVSFEDLLEDWREVASRIGEASELSWLYRSLLGAAEEIDGFLAPRLRHHASTAQEVESSREVPQWVKDVFQWMVQAATGEPPETEQLDGVAQAVQRVEALYVPVLENLKEKVARHGRELEAADPRFSKRGSRIKLLAFYLPQYHPIPENDAWWGKGFTEWTNVTRARPCFRGHVQPFLPSELGFYDLRVPEVRQQQATLARKYGIFGFCYYYYWFNGKKLLERPLEDMLESGEPDFPFCICWANENWTRKWDGDDQEILVAQEHTPENDARFIDDVLPILLDERYVKRGGMPVLLVYRADLLADPVATTDHWRKVARQAGLPGLHLCSVWRVEDPRTLGFDAMVEFPPHHFHYETITDTVEEPVEGYAGEIFDYAAGADAATPLEEKPFPVYRGVMTRWDNTARRGKQSWFFAGSTPEKYGEWLQKVVQEAFDRSDEDDQFVFVNAWNEWAEGAVLEPSRTYGRAYLEATLFALEKGQTLPGLSQMERRLASRQRELDSRLSQAHGDMHKSLMSQQEALYWLRQVCDELSHASGAHQGILRQLQSELSFDGGLCHRLSSQDGQLYEIRRRIENRPARDLWLSPHCGLAGLLLRFPFWLASGRLASRLDGWRKARRIRRSGLFDAPYYLERYPEVTTSGMEPLYHYVRFGAAEGRDPNPYFNGRRYLERFPEAAAVNPLVHYLDRGAPEVDRKTATPRPGQEEGGGVPPRMADQRTPRKLASSAAVCDPGGFPRCGARRVPVDLAGDPEALHRARGRRGLSSAAEGRRNRGRLPATRPYPSARRAHRVARPFARSGDRPGLGRLCRAGPADGSV